MARAIDNSLGTLPNKVVMSLGFLCSGTQDIVLLMESEPWCYLTLRIVLCLCHRQQQRPNSVLSLSTNDKHSSHKAGRQYRSSLRPEGQTSLHMLEKPQWRKVGWQGCGPLPSETESHLQGIILVLLLDTQMSKLYWAEHRTTF